MTPKQEKLRKAYEFKIGKFRTDKLSDDQILLLSMYYGSLTESEQSDIDSALAQGRRNDLTDMADAFISEIEEEPYEPSDIIKQYDQQFDEAVAEYNKKVEDFKEKEDKRIAGMFQYEKPIGPAAMQGPKPMQGPKEPPVQGPKEPAKKKPQADDPWEGEVPDQLGTKLDEILEQIRKDPLPQPTKTKRRKSKGKKVLSRKSYTAQELGVGESLNEILQNIVETREAMLNLYKLEKQRFEFKKKIDKKLTAALAAKKRERDLEKPKDPNTGVPKKKSFAQKAKEYTKKSLIEAAITAAFVAALPLIIEGLRPFFKDRTQRDMENAREGYNNQALDFMNVFPDDILNTPAGTFNPEEGGPSSAADQSSGLGSPIPPSPPGPKGPSNLSDQSDGLGQFSGGGKVPGTGNGDTVPAMLTPGEFVMSKGAVNTFGLGLLMSMNKRGGGTNRPTYKNMIPGYEGGGPVGKLPQSGSDFWTLVAVAGTEDNDPQAWADVAQSIYNRAKSGAYAGGSSIRQLILQPEQYEPTWKHPVRKAEKTPNYEWYNIVDINTAAEATGKSVEYLQRVADTIQNPDYQKKAAEFVQGRTDFMGGKEKPRFDLGDVRRGEQGEDNFFGFFAGPGAEAYGATNPDPAAIPSFVGTNAKMKPQQQPQAQRGDQSKPGAAPQEKMGFFEFINPIRIFNEIRTNVHQKLKENEEIRIQRNENIKSSLRSFNRTTPVEASPRRNVSMIPEIATMMSAPPPPLPDIAKTPPSSPAGRRSPQQPGA